MSRRPNKRRATKRGASKRGSRGSVARRIRKKKTAAAKRRTAKRTPSKTRRKRRAAAPTATAKAKLRGAMRARRAQLSNEEQRNAAERLVAQLATTRLFLVSRRIACYLPNDGEIDASGVLERIWRMKKSAFLPVLAPGHDRLWFAPAVPGMELRPNRFGIPEPQARARELVRAEDLDLILLPLVAFDAKGNRVGRGAGFYDRSLAFLGYRNFLRKPHLLGLAHDFQRVPAIMPDPWDVALDGVVTDRGVYYANP